MEYLVVKLSKNNTAEAERALNERAAKGFRFLYGAEAGQYVIGIMAKDDGSVPPAPRPALAIEKRGPGRPKKEVSVTSEA
jgi:hypothetical protein